MHFNIIEEESMVYLERHFEEEEIVQALKSMDGDKAPGPDGITIDCFPVLLECG
jgi:hypothetical protein